MPDLLGTTRVRIGLSRGEIHAAMTDRDEALRRVRLRIALRSTSGNREYLVTFSVGIPERQGQCRTCGLSGPGARAGAYGPGH